MVEVCCSWVCLDWNKCYFTAFSCQTHVLGNPPEAKFPPYWRKHALRMWVGHLTWNLRLSKLIFIIMWEITQWWRAVCRITGTQPDGVLHDRAERGGGQMTQRAPNGARTITWLFPEHSVLVYDVCKLKPHEQCHVLYLTLAEAFICTLIASQLKSTPLEWLSWTPTPSEDEGVSFSCHHPWQVIYL